jgi:hypothetical protein
VAWTVRKELICPSCGVIVAVAAYRRYPPRLIVTSPEGSDVMPEGVGTQLLLARQRNDEAAVRWLKQHVEELVLDLGRSRSVSDRRGR